MLIRTLTAMAMLALTATTADAATLLKSYSYFSVGGSTLDEIEAELSRHGPSVKTSGQRHPGATRMAFTTKVGYAGTDRRCRVVDAKVTLKANLILPKWRRSKRADRDVKLIWDTLASDIKRHEESHVVIAKNHARDLEQALLKVAAPNCAQAALQAKAVAAKILARHDRAQDAFDRVEGINFEARLTRLLHYRLQRMSANN